MYIYFFSIYFCPWLKLRCSSIWALIQDSCTQIFPHYRNHVSASAWRNPWIPARIWIHDFVYLGTSRGKNAKKLCMLRLLLPKWKVSSHGPSRTASGISTLHRRHLFPRCASLRLAKHSPRISHFQTRALCKHLNSPGTQTFKAFRHNRVLHSQGTQFMRFEVRSKRLKIPHKGINAEAKKQRIVILGALWWQDDDNAWVRHVAVTLAKSWFFLFDSFWLSSALVCVYVQGPIVASSHHLTMLKVESLQAPLQAYGKAPSTPGVESGSYKNCSCECGSLNPSTIAQPLKTRSIYVNLIWMEELGWQRCKNMMHYSLSSGKLNTSGSLGGPDGRQL